jgi:hypothetical protein
MAGRGGRGLRVMAGSVAKVEISRHGHFTGSFKVCFLLVATNPFCVALGRSSNPPAGENNLQLEVKACIFSALGRRGVA